MRRYKPCDFDMLEICYEILPKIRPFRVITVAEYGFSMKESAVMLQFCSNICGNEKNLCPACLKRRDTAKKDVPDMLGTS